MISRILNPLGAIVWYVLRVSGDALLSSEFQNREADFSKPFLIFSKKSQLRKTETEKRRDTYRVDTQNSGVSGKRT